MKKNVILFLIMIFGATQISARERVLLNDNWTFFRYANAHDTDSLLYDVRPILQNAKDYVVADAEPTEAVRVKAESKVLKPWILPTANAFIKDKNKHFVRPEGNVGGDFAFVQSAFDDSKWETVRLPHDWAIKGPFFEGWEAEVSGGMGRLPVNGVGWYRRKLQVSAADANKKLYLDIDGAMSYAMVWCNGQLVGGWPYGYNSWRLDLTPYLRFGAENQLAIRVDNPNHSARWYPGAGLYRNVWLTKTHQVHVAHWGTFVKTENVSTTKADILLDINIVNNSNIEQEINTITQIFELSARHGVSKKSVATMRSTAAKVGSKQSTTFTAQTTLSNPKLWGPPPTQKPNLYIAKTSVWVNGVQIDSYETRFGVRSLQFDPKRGTIVNGEPIRLRGVNQHHDLGALGAAFNTRAAERQLEILRDMGCNAIRIAHNPPAPELLELTDKMGFLVINEVFDSWERKKTDHDFHLIFPEWYEADARSFVRRDKNSPSVIMWSFGNEVGEQYTDTAGAAIAQKLHEIVKDEDPTRPTTISMNFAKPDFPIAGVADIIGLNYQGEGIRQDPEFEGTERIRTPPQYIPFHTKFPNKMIYSSETASAASSRGIYLFPVTQKQSDIIRDGRGGDSKTAQVSAYELHAVDFGSSAERVFASLEQHPFIAGEFVWNGFDYLGEPTPYYEARSSYTGMIDLAGFPKDRYFLYQSHWRKHLPMVHILPHWNWENRKGEITPVHIFTSGDEVELFLNGKSLGRKKKAALQYRLRWDDVRYEAGELRAVAYKNGKQWATQKVVTTHAPAILEATADRKTLSADGYDLTFVTVRVTDNAGRVVPNASNLLNFSVQGAGEIVATDNGDATDLTSFASHSRKAFSGLCLVVVRTRMGEKGKIVISASSEGLKGAKVVVKAK